MSVDCVIASNGAQIQEANASSQAWMENQGCLPETTSGTTRSHNVEACTVGEGVRKCAPRKSLPRGRIGQ